MEINIPDSMKESFELVERFIDRYHNYDFVGNYGKFNYSMITTASYCDKLIDLLSDEIGNLIGNPSIMSQYCEYTDNLVRAHQNGTCDEKHLPHVPNVGEYTDFCTLLMAGKHLSPHYICLRIP